MPSSFKTKLLVQAPEGEETCWTLMADFMFYLDEKDMESETILVRRGFTTDFASIPRPLWWLYPPYDPVYGKAAVLHDALYAAHVYERAKCDELFRLGSKILGCSLFTRNVMYAAVRTCGGPIYDGKTKDQLSIATTQVLRIPKGQVSAYRAGSVTVGDLITLQREKLAK